MNRKTRAAYCDQFSRAEQLLPVIFHRCTTPDSKRILIMPSIQKTDRFSWKSRNIGILWASERQLPLRVRARDQFSRAERELNVRIACLNSIKVLLGVVLACAQNTAKMTIFGARNQSLFAAWDQHGQHLDLVVKFFWNIIAFPARENWSRGLRLK